ncbi:MAG TPA: ATP-grasp domain-containing protein [Terriglobia bacterium]|nr:ATP-grasp domain-containing protein [Terriglobia bacterium]
MDRKRLLILCTTTGYQTRAFIEAAENLGLAIALGTDRCHVLDDPWQDGALALRFADPEASARQIVEYANGTRIDGIVSLGDRPTSTAARVCQALKLLHHPPWAADICRDKYLSREKLRNAGLNVPTFNRFPLGSNPDEVLVSGGAEIPFPCVLKPLALSGSRGVIRANNPKEFTAAFRRIRALLRSPDVQVMREETSDFIQVESYVEGGEIAVEGLVDRGRLQTLAIFDKPDPLTGPYFEETIYVTPTRLEPRAQAAVIAALEHAVTALGLFHGPLHAELRLNAQGVWIMEMAARSIGGLCSRALRFHAFGDANLISLEELIIRLALGEPIDGVCREDEASGVMMIPIPAAGIFEQVDGVEQALGTPGVEEIRITARPQQKLVPLPEGCSYLGFIFARGTSPEIVEESLRQAHGILQFKIARALPVV